MRNVRCRPRNLIVEPKLRPRQSLLGRLSTKLALPECVFFFLRGALFNDFCVVNDSLSDTPLFDFCRSAECARRSQEWRFFVSSFPIKSPFLSCQRPRFPHKGCPQKHFDIEVISRAFLFALYAVVLFTLMNIDEPWVLQPHLYLSSNNINNIPPSLCTYCCTTNNAVYFLLSNKYGSLSAVS